MRLGCETAIEMWKLLLKDKFLLLDKWLEFLEVGIHLSSGGPLDLWNIQDEKPKTVSKDLWNQLLDFAIDVKPDLSNYDPNGNQNLKFLDTEKIKLGAWPVLVDSFVEWMQKKEKWRN